MDDTLYKKYNSHPTNITYLMAVFVLKIIYWNLEYLFCKFQENYRLLFSQDLQEEVRGFIIFNYINEM